MDMSLFWIDTDVGCGIRSAANIEEARENAKRECGTAFFRSVRAATREDISHVGAMGGYIPNA